MRVLLISTYELGHQPLHVASPAASLQRAGHEVRCIDTSVERLEPAGVSWAEAVAFSVPMHTAMRLALKGAERVRALDPGKPICLYGLYAPVSSDQTLGKLADHLIAGEYEGDLVAWIDGLAAKPGARGQEKPLISLGHDRFLRPARDLLPGLERYARLALDDERRLVGYVEASHGCAHQCRHCPIPSIYGGRIRLVPRGVVLEDIAQLVEMGARHITFGDPDFLNGWKHSMTLTRAMHERWPELTFDVTTKVEHILANAGLWPELEAAGCLFVVSAVECVNDDILQRLDKGHSATDAAQAVDVLRSAGIEMRPSFMPFTPWTTPRDVLDLLGFVVRNDLIGNVDPVQYTIRLLLPEGSLLLEHPDVRPHLESYDPQLLTYRWSAADPASDDLQRHLTHLVESEVAAESPPGATFLKVHAAVARAAGETFEPAIPSGSLQGRPRLTEPWFC